MLCLDRDRAAWAEANAANPVSAVTSEHLAYVIYLGIHRHTQGVAVPHQAVTRLVCNTDYAQIQSDDA